MKGKSSNIQKYKSSNPIKKFLLGNFLKKIRDMILTTRSKTILDAGCGEGMIINYLYPNTCLAGRQVLGYKDIKREFFGIDMSETAIDEARKRVPFAKLIAGSIYSLPYPDNFFDLVICSEVLEHLENPEKALGEIKRVTNKYALLSVPNEPFFRISSFLSGKYLKTFGNHPEHIQNWSKGNFVLLIEKHFNIKKATTSFPWTLVLVEKGS